MFSRGFVASVVGDPEPMMRAVVPAHRHRTLMQASKVDVEKIKRSHLDREVTASHASR
jgi:hypothetical protein